LGVRTHKAVLLLHILAAGTWFGLDIAMAAPVFTAVAADDPSTKAYSYRALELFAVWPLFTAGLVSLVSGIVLSLGTTYGLLRYWWVVIKLALNVVLTALILVALRPEVTSLANRGEQFAAGEAVTFLEDNIVFPPVVSPIALLIAFILAVYKPWGRIRRSAG
jgi:uncharacterized membrane protein